MSENLDFEVFRLLSYGLYIVSSKLGEKYNGQIVNTVIQVTAEPPRFAVSINKQNLTYEYIKQSRIFSVSILDEEAPLTFIGLFGFKSGRDVDKFSKIAYETDIEGCPVVTEHTLGMIEVKVIDEVDVGTHTLFIGDAIKSKILRKGVPLTYSHYHQVKGGKTPKTAPIYLPEVPKTAPTYIPSDEKTIETTRESNGQRYQCEVCGWIYDPVIGDPAQGIAPGTAFADIASEWVCPVCGARKDQFRPL